MGSSLVVDFKFDIGDIVYSRTSNSDCSKIPTQFIVFERLAQECHGGIQKLYRLDNVKEWVSEVMLSLDEPPMRIRSKASIAEEVRVKAIFSNMKRLESDRFWKANEAAAAKVQEQGDKSDG